MTPEEILAKLRAAKAARSAPDQGSVYERLKAAKAARAAPQEYAPDPARARQAARVMGMDAPVAAQPSLVRDGRPAVEPTPLNGYRDASQTRVDWGAAPMGASESDPPHGQTELGETTYMSPTGTVYTRPMVTTVPRTKTWSDVGVGDVVNSMGSLASGVAQGVMSGIAAPGRALRGEVVTNNDVTATAGLVGGGGMTARNAPGQVAAPVNAGKAAMRDMGVQPSLGMRGKPAAMMAAGLEKLLPSAHVIANDAARMLGQVEKAFAGAAAPIGRALSPDAAGGVAQKSIRGFVDRFKKKATELYDTADALIPSATTLPLDKFRTVLDDAKTFFAANPSLARKLGLNDWDSIAQEAAKNGVPWEAVKQLRTSIGEAIGSRGTGPLSDQSLGRLNRMYEALTGDMTAGATALGPAALGAWRRANSYYKAGATRISEELDGLIGKDPASGPSGERAFEALAAMSKSDRATSDVVRMRRIRSSMDDDAWGTVAASIVDRMGKAKPGAQTATGDAFSPTTFLTEWNKMSPEAKRLLLPDAARKELQKLAEIAGLVKSANAERNMSNTGTVGGMAATGLAGMADVGTAGGFLAGSYLTAKAMTSQGFLRALNLAARGTTGPMRALANGRDAMATTAQAALGALPSAQEERQ